MKQMNRNKITSIFSPAHLASQLPSCSQKGVNLASYLHDTVIDCSTDCGDSRHCRRRLWCVLGVACAFEALLFSTLCLARSLLPPFLLLPQPPLLQQAPPANASHTLPPREIANLLLHGALGVDTARDLRLKARARKQLATQAAG